MIVVQPRAQVLILGDKALPIGQPHGLVKYGTWEAGEVLGLAGRSIHQLDGGCGSAGIGQCDSAAVGRPCDVTVRGSNGTSSDYFLARAIRIGHKKLELADVGIVVAVKRNAAAVRRKRCVRIDPVHDDLGIAAENRCAVQVKRIVSGRLRLAEIKVVSVRGKLEIRIIRFRWRNDLGVAVGRNVAEPEAGLARVIDHAQDIFPIGRNGRNLRLGVVGDLGDGIILERNDRLAVKQRKHAIARRGHQNKRNPSPCRQGQLVALRRLNQRAARRVRRRLCSRTAFRPNRSRAGVGSDIGACG